jgi:hypothetical protein
MSKGVTGSVLVFVSIIFKSMITCPTQLEGCSFLWRRCDVPRSKHPRFTESERPSHGFSCGQYPLAPQFGPQPQLCILCKQSPRMGRNLSNVRNPSNDWKRSRNLGGNRSAPAPSHLDRDVGQGLHLGVINGTSPRNTAYIIRHCCPLFLRWSHRLRVGHPRHCRSLRSWLCLCLYPL